MYTYIQYTYILYASRSPAALRMERWFMDCLIPLRCVLYLWLPYVSLFVDQSAYEVNTSTLLFP